MKSCPRACNNRTTHENRQTGCEGSRLPFFSGAGDTLRVSPGPLPAISKEICTIILHSSYTAKI
jgi:hypothetical protein